MHYLPDYTSVRIPPDIKKDHAIEKFGPYFEVWLSTKWGGIYPSRKFVEEYERRRLQVDSTFVAPMDANEWMFHQPDDPIFIQLLRDLGSEQSFHPKTNCISIQKIAVKFIDSYKIKAFDGIHYVEIEDVYPAVLNQDENFCKIPSIGPLANEIQAPQIDDAKWDEMTWSRYDEGNSAEEDVAEQDVPEPKGDPELKDDLELKELVGHYARAQLESMRVDNGVEDKEHDLLVKLLAATMVHQFTK